MQRKIIAVAIASLVSSAAFAAPQGYVSVGVGASKANVDCGDISCDKNGTAAKIVGGYVFADNFAGELTYQSLGTATVHDTVDVDFKGSYWGLGGAWRPEFGSGWGGVVRAGVAFTTGKVESSGLSFSHNSTQPYLGLGVTYAFSKEWEAELDWDNTKVQHEVDGVSSTTTVNAVSIVGTYKF